MKLVREHLLSRPLVHCDLCEEKVEAAAEIDLFGFPATTICFPCLQKALALNPATPPSAENPSVRSLETSLHDRKLSVRVDGKLISTIVDVHGLSLVSLRSSERLVDLAVYGEEGKPRCVTLRY